MIWLLPVWEWNVTNLATILLSYIVWVIDFIKSLSFYYEFVCSYFLFMGKHDKLIGMCTQMTLSYWLKNHEYLSIFLQLVHNHMLTGILIVDGYLWLSHFFQKLLSVDSWDGKQSLIDFFSFLNEWVEITDCK